MFNITQNEVKKMINYGYPERKIKVLSSHCTYKNENNELEISVYMKFNHIWKNSFTLKQWLEQAEFDSLIKDTLIEKITKDIVLEKGFKNSTPQHNVIDSPISSIAFEYHSKNRSETTICLSVYNEITLHELEFHINNAAIVVRGELPNDYSNAKLPWEE